MNKDDLSTKIKDLIVNKSGTPEENTYHTIQIAKCSEGDLEAIKYMKTLIKEYLKIEEEYDENLVDEIFSEHWGLYILDKYNTPDVDEIIVLGKEILLKRDGEIVVLKEQFDNEEQVKSIMRRCIEFNKESDLNEKNATKSSIRADGSRIQIVIPLISQYPVLNIRNFGYVPTTENMLKNGTFTQKHVDILSTLVKGRANIIIIGDTESGKTTTLKWLVKWLDDDFIIATLETSFEANLKDLYPNKHIIALQERENYPLKDLFPISLRQSVDVIIVPESRSYEINDVIKAMRRGHRGSMTSLHTETVYTMIDDIVDMVLESGMNVNYNYKRQQVAKAVDIVIKMGKLPKNENNKRKKICEGIYEIIEDDEKFTYDIVPIMELKFDEENPKNSNEQIYLNPISDKLKHKLNKSGLKMSDINKVFRKDTVSLVESR